jgi:hypothetical protein
MARSIARWSLLATSLLALALVAAELFAAAPLHVYPFACIAAVLLAVGEILRRPAREAVVAGALAFALFVSNARQLGSGDTLPAAAIPYLLIRNHTLSLDTLELPTPRPYWVALREGRAWSEYPVAAGVLAVPVFLPAVLGPSKPWDLPQADKLAAALFAALSVALVFAGLRRLGVPLAGSCLVTTLYAAGSPMLSVASQSLWQHGPSALGLAGMIWATLRSRERPTLAWAAGAFAGLACAARASDLLVVAPFWLATVLEDRRRALHFAVAAALPLALVAAYDSYAFGAPWRTGYDFTDTPRFSTDLHLGALLLSPTRGLLPFSPWVAIGITGCVVGARADRHFAALALGAAGTVLLYSAWSMWWGGVCYGPRLLCDLMPVFAIGCAPLLQTRRRWVWPALAATGAVAIFLHGFYAFASGHPAAVASAEVSGDREAMEWQRFPLAALLRLP